jgi:hypothetical protein
MRNFTIYLALSLCLLVSKSVAQDTFESKAKAIAEKITKITNEEKTNLKSEVEEVNMQFEKGTITKDQAEDRKKKLAEARAAIIENRIEAAQIELRDLVQAKVDGKIKSFEHETNVYDSVVINGKKQKIKYTVTDSTYINVKGMRRKYFNNKNIDYEKRTTTQFVLAAGFNNLVTNKSVANSDFRYWGSHFYEWGMTFNTRIAKNNNLLHAKYGLSVMYNNLRPTEDRTFVVTENKTTLESSSIDLRDSRFRNVYLVMPLHLELDFSKKTVSSNNSYFRTHQSFRLGLGGYFGTRIKSKQILEFDLDNHDFTNNEKGDFNVNNFIYGLSTYVGYKATSLYLKYDLNPMFDSNAVKQYNVSLGIRFDFN